MLHPCPVPPQRPADQTGRSCRRAARHTLQASNTQERHDRATVIVGLLIGAHTLGRLEFSQLLSGPYCPPTPLTAWSAAGCDTSTVAALLWTSCVWMVRGNTSLPPSGGVVCVAEEAAGVSRMAQEAGFRVCGALAHSQTFLHMSAMRGWSAAA